METGTFLGWTLLAALAAGGGLYAYMEYHSYLLRTRLFDIEGGVRFEARGLTLEARFGARELEIEAQNARFARRSSPEAKPVEQSGPLTIKLAPLGLRIKTVPIVIPAGDKHPALESGFSDLLFEASDEQIAQFEGRSEWESSVLRVVTVPNKIVSDLMPFVYRVQLWVAKLEHGLQLEREARRKEEEERARAEARAEAQRKAAVRKSPISDEEREARIQAHMAKLREAAGFKGSTTEYAADPFGELLWFIDLDPYGRVILQSGDRNFHGSLRGAKVMPVDNELEIGVRDDYWNDNEQQLNTFRVLQGKPAELRQAWRERLEALIRRHS